MRPVLLLATAAVALLPTGARRAFAKPQLQCPMPVKRPDSAAAERMPVFMGNTAVPMPTKLPECANPLFVARDSAGAGVLPNRRLERTRP